jgi:hypothetical protein
LVPNWSAALALIALMGLTVSDALLRSFANRPILGAGDLVQVSWWWWSLARAAVRRRRAGHRHRVPSCVLLPALGRDDCSGHMSSAPPRCSTWPGAAG